MATCAGRSSRSAPREHDHDQEWHANIPPCGTAPPNTSMANPATESFWALVLAGGDGTRLQGVTCMIAGAPIPKQYCRILGSRSLLEATLRRIAPLVAPE